MGYWLGIDVGTTFTAAALCRQEPGRRALPEVVALGTRSTAVSSVVYLGEDGQVVVGEAAERRAHTHPERVVREFKRRIGDEVPMVIGGVPHSAPEIAAMVVRWVVDRVTEREGGPAAGIVITHPAGWGEYKIQTVADALRGADLPEVTFRSEPEAAAASYALQERVDSGSTIAVYDLGGGTFDAAVVRKTGATTFSVLGVPQGIEQLGGADFDDAVFGHVVAAVPALSELDPEAPATLAATAALRRECTEAKEALSADTEVTIPVLAPEIQSQVRLVRAEFEDMIRPQVQATVEALHRALRSADVSPQDLDAVLLVGGSSRVPLVAQLVSAEFGRPVAVDADPKAAIALGAALSAFPPDIPDSNTAEAAPAPDAPLRGEVIIEPPTSPAWLDVQAGVQLEAPPRPSLTAIPLDVESAEREWSRARSRRLRRVVMAGVLALFTTAGVASVPFLASRSGPVAPADAGTPPGAAPVTATTNPAADTGNSDEASHSGGFNRPVRATPTVAVNKPVGGTAKTALVVPTRAPQPTGVTTYSWSTSWSDPPVTTSPAPTTAPTPTTAATTAGPTPTTTHATTAGPTPTTVPATTNQTSSPRRPKQPT